MRIYRTWTVLVCWAADGCRGGDTNHSESTSKDGTKDTTRDGVLESTRLGVGSGARRTGGVGAVTVGDGAAIDVSMGRWRDRLFVPGTHVLPAMVWLEPVAAAEATREATARARMLNCMLTGGVVGGGGGGFGWETVD